MSFFVDPSLLGPLVFVALALSGLVAGWVWAYGAGVRAASISLASRPAQLGPYTLMEKMGEGAMGEVYRAYHRALGTWRAVKVLPYGASERERERFEKEAVLGAELRHPNSVTIYEHGEAADGTSYYAMELVEGVTLSALVERQGPLPAERVVQILLQLCDALEEAHDKGLVHRDIKPDNVLSSADGRVKLIDFGLIERVGETGRGEAVDAVVGTPLYISPEAIVAPEQVGPRSDLYALGAVAYFLLTGSPVFRGRSVVEVCGHHLHTAPERLSQVLGDETPAELERIVLDCLAKDAEQRPASAGVLRQRLRACLEREGRVPLARSPRASDGTPSRDTAAASDEAAAVDVFASTVASASLVTPLEIAFVRLARACDRLDAVPGVEARDAACRRAA
jgi:eukaryotic-like serine/threonine-protein kinase